MIKKLQQHSIINSKVIFLVVLFGAVMIIAPLSAIGFLPAIIIIAAMFGILSLIFFRTRIHLGFPLIVISSLLIPFSISTGTQTSINSTILISLLLFAAWIMDVIVFKQSGPEFKSRTEILAIVFGINTILAFAFGQFNWYPTRAASFFAQVGQSLLFILSAVVFLTTAYKIKDSKWIRWTVFLFIVIGGIYSVGFLFPPLRQYVNRIFQRAVIDSMFWSWLIILSFSQAFLNKDLPKGIRFLFMMISISALFNVFVSRQSWVSGWLPAAIGIFIVLFLYKPKFAIGSAFLFAAIFIIQSQLLSDYLLVGDNEYSMLSRVEAWKIMAEIIKKNPFFGVGPANYYFYTPFYNILGYHVQFNSHNNYIDIIAQVGFIGLFIFIWWMIEIGKLGLNLLQKELTTFDRSFTLAALGGLGATLTAAMLGDWVIPFIYNIGMEGFRSAVFGWIFFGALLFLTKKYLTEDGNRV